VSRGQPFPKPEIRATGRNGELTFTTKVGRSTAEAVLGATDIQRARHIFRCGVWPTLGERVAVAGTVARAAEPGMKGQNEEVRSRIMKSYEGPKPQKPVLPLQQAPCKGIQELRRR
jgi:hypothetical protein